MRVRLWLQCGFGNGDTVVRAAGGACEGILVFAEGEVAGGCQAISCMRASDEEVVEESEVTEMLKRTGWPKMMRMRIRGARSKMRVESESRTADAPEPWAQGQNLRNRSPIM